jgi:hypothetical protein
MLSHTSVKITGFLYSQGQADRYWEEKQLQVFALQLSAKVMSPPRPGAIWILQGEKKTPQTVVAFHPVFPILHVRFLFQRREGFDFSHLEIPCTGAENGIGHSGVVYVHVDIVPVTGGYVAVIGNENVRSL